MYVYFLYMYYVILLPYLEYWYTFNKTISSKMFVINECNRKCLITLFVIIVICDVILKRETFLQNNFDHIRLSSIARHFTILYRKSMKFGIQEELLLSFLDTKFYLFSLQNIRMTSNWSWFEGKRLIKIILLKSVAFHKLCHMLYTYIRIHVELSVDLSTITHM